jgi:hypothetical protein
MVPGDHKRYLFGVERRANSQVQTMIVLNHMIYSDILWTRWRRSTYCIASPIANPSYSRYPCSSNSTQRINNTIFCLLRPLLPLYSTSSLTPLTSWPRSCARCLRGLAEWQRRLDGGWLRRNTRCRNAYSFPHRSVRSDPRDASVSIYVS